MARTVGEADETPVRAARGPPGLVPRRSESRAVLRGSRSSRKAEERERNEDRLAREGRRLEDADDPDPPGRARAGLAHDPELDMPTLAGFTEILTIPCLSETPLLRMPAPLATTRTPGTRLPRRVTTALMVLRLPTVSVFVETVSVGHITTAGGGRNGLTSVGSSSLLLAVFVSASAPTITVMFRIVPGCSGRTRIVTVTVAPTGIVPTAQVTSWPEAEQVPCVELDER